MPSVLVIDDSRTQRAWLRAVLEDRQLRVVDCDSADIAGLALTATQMHLVMVALRPVTSNGFELGLRLREAGCVNVVVYSDSVASTDGDWARAIGLQAVVAVPAPVQLLRRQVLDLIECRRPESGHGHVDKSHAA